MSTQPPLRADFEPDFVLLLCGDPADPVTRALVERHRQLGWPLALLQVHQLLDGVELGEVWTVQGQRLDPGRTALVNRLPLSDRLEAGDDSAAGLVSRQALWSRLREELGRFRYASSLPTASSIIGCHGSLLDQWQDLPRLVPGLRVPEHSAASVPRALRGRVFLVDRWTLYSLGKPRDEASAAALPESVRLDYVRPNGRLVHVVQVGEAFLFNNAPPDMTPAQGQAMIDVAQAFARVSTLRILEHAFFVGDGQPPVLYSTCPVPLMGARHPRFPDLVLQGLRHDIRKWHGRPAS